MAQACLARVYPHLAATCDNPAPAASDRPPPVLSVVPWSPEPEAEPAFGSRYGRRELTLDTFGETKEWKALAHDLEAARLHLNATLPNARKWSRERALEIEPATSTDDPRVTKALRDYRGACAQLFLCKTPRPRHLPALIRATAELCGVADPVWLRPWEIKVDGPLSDREFFELALYELYNKAQAALRDQKPAARGPNAKRERKSRASER